MDCEIHFLVQSPYFSPKNIKNVHVIKIPNKKAINQAKGDEPTELTEYLLSRDRGAKYFCSGISHYGYYYNEINTVLNNIAPDLVIGECTLFHELMTCFICKKLNISYIHPAGSRYPPGRFQIFMSDSQEVAISSNDSWSNESMDAFILSVNSGNIRPEYMAKANSLRAIFRYKFLRFFYWIKVSISNFFGEKYNTPTIKRKFVLTYKLSKTLKEWDRSSSLPTSKKNILYPMQMQPEANIDVWGSKYSDQAILIKKIASMLPPDFNLIVKANPKPKYELLDITKVVMSSQNIYLAPRHMNMTDLEKNIHGIITVTGTVGFESIFKASNCISLGHPMIEEKFSKYSANSLKDAIFKLIHFKPDIYDDNPKKLLKNLIKDSFDGVVGDPLYSPHAQAQENIYKIAKKIYKCLI